jgi:hypothetical protein
LLSALVVSTHRQEWRLHEQRTNCHGACFQTIDGMKLSLRPHGGYSWSENKPRGSLQALIGIESKVFKDGQQNQESTINV